MSEDSAVFVGDKVDELLIHYNKKVYHHSDFSVINGQVVYKYDLPLNQQGEKKVNYLLLMIRPNKMHILQCTDVGDFNGPGNLELRMIKPPISGDKVKLDKDLARAMVDAAFLKFLGNS